jgi:hypothetical protein
MSPEGKTAIVAKKGRTTKNLRDLSVKKVTQEDQGRRQHGHEGAKREEDRNV